MKRIWFVLWVGAGVGVMQSWSPIYAQSEPSPTSESAAVPDGDVDFQPFTDAELDRLLGPIALFPDPLIAVLLPASTQPSQVVLAARFLNGGGDPESIEAQPWTEAVKATAHYGGVLRWMDENLAWTTQLGEAFLRQPEQVMDTIQRLRELAQSLGNLKTSQEETVQTDDGLIDIVPTDPDIVYVPVYEPEVIYVQAGAPVRFDPGVRVGTWFQNDWDWRNRRVIVWSKENFRPRTWWTLPRAQRFAPASNGAVTFKEWCPRSHKGQSKWWALRAQNRQNESVGGAQRMNYVPATPRTTGTTAGPGATRPATSGTVGGYSTGGHHAMKPAARK